MACRHEPCSDPPQTAKLAALAIGVSAVLAVSYLIYSITPDIVLYMCSKFGVFCPPDFVDAFRYVFIVMAATIVSLSALDYFKKL